MRHLALLLALALLFPAGAAAKIELVTLPARGATQLTIYNSVDLTLVRDERELTFKKGVNRIEFSWENTLIDPTSVTIEPMAGAPPFQVVDTVFPPRIANTLVWNITSDAAGKVPVRISYFTSGITWAADYGLVLNAAETEAGLVGCVSVTNGSGEDYENSQVRLVVGKVHLVERIDDLASRQNNLKDKIDEFESSKSEGKMMLSEEDAGCAGGAPCESSAPKEIVKEGLSEYFIYTVEGRETIENTWAKRLPSLNVKALPVESVFKHEDFRLGPDAVRFVTFKNDKAHAMGTEPLPDGAIRVMKVDAKGNLQYLGSSDQKYVPVDGTVEINLGADREVKVEIKLMDYKIDNFNMNYQGDPAGWDTTANYSVKVRNFKSNPVRLEIKRRHDGTFSVVTERPFEREDARTLLFKFDVEANRDFVFDYTVRTYNGTNAEGR